MKLMLIGVAIGIIVRPTYHIVCSIRYGFEEGWDEAILKHLEEKGRIKRVVK